MVGRESPSRLADIAQRLLIWPLETWFLPRAPHFILIVKVSRVNINPAFKIYLKFCQNDLLTHDMQHVERIMKQTELKNQKKEAQIDAMTPEAVLNELKDKRLPTYGTAAERKDRLKKQYGIQPKAK